MRRCPAPEFRLDTTLASGQVFRWQQVDEWYYGVIAGALVKISQRDDTLHFDSHDPRLTDERLTQYFALDQDLDQVLASIDHDDHMHAAILAHRGLRLIRQEPWECTASYLLTAFNNIQRITRIIENLCQQFGRPITFEGWRTYTFPSPETIADVPLGRLGLLGLGFRAAHLAAVARRFADRSFRPEDVRGAPYAVVKQRLMELPGIGDKVADCIALFAFQRYEAFPIDVWVRRALALYLPKEQLTLKRMHAFAAAHFGAHAGYAQQYLYHALRQRAEQTRYHPTLAKLRMHSRLLMRPIAAETPVNSGAD